MTSSSAGIGIDVVDIDRFERAFQRAGFRERIFTAREIADCEDKPKPVEAFAARFAAKEACFKAFADPRLKAVPWSQIETVITGDIPSLKLHGAYRERLRGRKVFLSLSHSHRIAAAVVLLLPEESSSCSE
jgi:holo-[acyl-carrier protein] synthase